MNPARKDFTLTLLSRSGAFRLGDSLSSRRLRVLTYHRVIPREHVADKCRASNTVYTDEFDEQMAFVNRHYRVLDRDELRACLNGDTPIPRHAMAITFDDGYENNFAHALPVLRRHGLHAAFFVTTGLIGRTDRLFWFDRLDRLLAAVSPDAVLARIVERDGSIRFVSGTRPGAYFKTLSSVRQAEILDDLERHFASAGLRDTARPLYRTMTWEQVRALVAAGMTVGSHSASHQILSAVPPEEAVRELRSSRAKIERETGGSCWCFAYPNGERNDFRPSDERAVADAGYTCAFTQMPGSIGPRSPRFALSRIPVPDTGDMRIFLLHVCGVQRWFRRAFPG
jgi:peptidoglycan/xylan/chitin deacetylase (PgdA/CDA1 family)